MKKNNSNIIIIASIILVIIGAILVVVFRQFSFKTASEEDIAERINKGDAIIYNETVITDDSNDLQVARTFIPDGYKVEFNVDWTLTSYIYPADISIKAYSEDRKKELNFFSTKEYLENLDDNDNIFGEEPRNDAYKSYTGAENYLLEKVKEISPNAENISVEKKESFTEEEISKMKEIVDVEAKNIDILLSPDEEHEDDDHGYVKILETSVEPAVITFSFEENGNSYKQKLSTIIYSIAIEHKSENNEIHRERLWTSSAVYGYKAENSVFDEDDSIYSMFILNTKNDQRWLTSLSRARQDLFFNSDNTKKEINIAKEEAPEILKKVYFNEKSEFKEGKDLMDGMMEVWDFFNKDTVKYKYFADTDIMVQEKYKSVYINNASKKVYTGLKDINLPKEWRSPDISIK